MVSGYKKKIGTNQALRAARKSGSDITLNRK
jgi:hypothetical protein